MKSNWSKNTRTKVKIHVLFKLLESEQEWANYFESIKDYPRKIIADGNISELNEEYCRLRLLWQSTIQNK